MARLISYLRMSTSEQLKGFSLERQRKLIADFAAKNGLSLDESHSIEDIGRSSFSDDAEQKQLARFFEDLDAGKFSPGDVFALENIDRLTRRGAIDALLKVNTILSKGLKLAIISDREQRILEEIDVFSIITLSIDAARSHSESKNKSDKGLLNWEEKRNLAATHKIAMTAQAPAWLDTETFYVMDESKGKQIKRRRYVLNPEKAETVRLIFELFQNGNGSLKIKNILNDRKIPTFKGAEYWEPSVISKILRNPATHGFYQPQKQRTGKRDLVPAGDPIEDYFPAIVSRETFEQCQRITAANSTRKGRKGKVFTNLFTGLLRCVDCGGPVHLLNPGIDKRAKVPKSVNYIVCKKGKFTRECILKRLRYDDFEAAMLKAIQEINLADVLNENNPLEQLIKQIRAIETRIEKNKTMLENFRLSFRESGTLPSFMIEEANNAENDNKSLEIERTELQAQMAQLNAYNTNIDNAIEELKTSGTYETRAKINLVLHEIIKTINIDFELVDFAIIFKNGVKRFVNDGIVQNVFTTKTGSDQYYSEIEEILNHTNTPPEK
ncbi:recombinase family protein [Pseudomonas juntendi]|uniref:recombinase family protein n=1 Tax=Pseudomonas juntendi TaxID=2666183 RepID=UPI0024468D0D|nr:recombinase family protein [Pseudomonas juntendi]MDH2014808.1 recombinase family protein [Pseudomonas juntendi]HEJ6524383.1 recombinase family protein [Pseudomonas aeruginosa]